MGTLYQRRKNCATYQCHTKYGTDIDACKMNVGRQVQIKKKTSKLFEFATRIFPVFHLLLFYLILFVLTELFDDD